MCTSQFLKKVYLFCATVAVNGSELPPRVHTTSETFAAKTPSVQKKQKTQHIGSNDFMGQ